MDEEEPMDISAEDSFLGGGSPGCKLNATIATSSPLRKEKKQLFSHQFAFNQFQGQGYKGQGDNPGIRMPTGIRKLHRPGERRDTQSSHRERDEQHSKHNDKDSPSKRAKYEKSHANKDKHGIFHNSKGKLASWGLIIALFFIMKIVFQFHGCLPTFDIMKLHSGLDSYVFGQHIAKEVVTSTLRDYFHDSASRNHTDLKPLVLSFHGWTGVGKNFIGNIIVNSFQKKRVKVFLAPLHFADILKNAQYKVDVQEWIKTNITLCKVNIFIFDEMDKAPSGVVDGLADVITELRSLQLHETWVIFLLLSNSKGGTINKHLFAELAPGKPRESITYDEIIPVITENSDKEWYQPLLEKNFVDKFVPFLPLTHTHVRQCVERDLKRKGRSPNEQLVSSILDELNYFSPKDHSEKYSYTGCKRVSDKVDLHIHDVLH